jgi:hypothetical protein
MDLINLIYNFVWGNLGSYGINSIDKTYNNWTYGIVVFFIYRHLGVLALFTITNLFRHLNFNTIVQRIICDVFFFGFYFLDYNIIISAIFMCIVFLSLFLIWNLDIENVKMFFVYIVLNVLSLCIFGLFFNKINSAFFSCLVVLWILFDYYFKKDYEQK